MHANLISRKDRINFVKKMFTVVTHIINVKW